VIPSSQSLDSHHIRVSAELRYARPARQAEIIRSQRNTEVAHLNPIVVKIVNTSVLLLRMYSPIGGLKLVPRAGIPKVTMVIWYTPLIVVLNLKIRKNSGNYPR